MKYCSVCLHCENPKKLLILSKKKKDTSYRTIECKKLFPIPLAPGLFYETTCWNARKHHGFCGMEGKYWKPC